MIIKSWDWNRGERKSDREGEVRGIQHDESNRLRSWNGTSWTFTGQCERADEITTHESPGWKSGSLFQGVYFLSYYLTFFILFKAISSSSHMIHSVVIVFYLHLSKNSHAYLSCFFDWTLSFMSGWSWKRNQDHRSVSALSSKKFRHNYHIKHD